MLMFQKSTEKGMCILFLFQCFAHLFQKSTEKGMCILLLFQCFAQPMLKCKKMEHIITLTF